MSLIPASSPLHDEKHERKAEAELRRLAYEQAFNAASADSRLSLLNATRT